MKDSILSKITDPLKQRMLNYNNLSQRDKLVLWGEFLIRNAMYIIIVLVVIYVQIYSIQRGFANTFLSFRSIIDILTRAASALFLALGVGGIIVLTGTDLSAGRIMGLIACVCASLLQMPVEEYSVKMFPNMVAPPIIIVLLLSMAIGAGFGLFNGFCTARFKLHPFIVTLATQLIVYGLVLIYVQFGTNGGGPISGLTEEYKDVVKYTVDFGGNAVPLYVFYAIAAVIVMWFIWNKTTLGKNMYAVGANPEAANVSGISVMKTTILIFVMAGVLYGISGFIESARIGSNSPATGLNAELDAIAACVIGGVSFTGGVGKISGIVTGVILLQIISVALQWLGVSGDIQYIIKGGIILIAVAIDMRKYLAKK